MTNAGSATVHYRDAHVEQSSLSAIVTDVRTTQLGLARTAPSEILCWPAAATGRAGYVRSPQQARGWRRAMHLALAAFWFGMAILGVILPGVPTTCFLLACSYSLLRSSHRLHNKLLASKLFGPSLRHWRLNRGVRPGVKTKAMSMLLLGVGATLALSGRPMAALAGIAGGADVILLPEIAVEMESIYEQLRARSERGKRYSVICCAEGAQPKGGAAMVDRVDPTSPDPIRLGGVARWLTDKIEADTGLESRSVSLGHTQRGGTPIALDRVLATRFGHHAMELLKAGAQGRLVVMQEAKLSDIDLTAAEDKQRLVPLEHAMIEAARAVYTCFGDEPTRGV